MLALQSIFFTLASILESDRREITLTNILSVQVIVEKDENGNHKTNETLLTIYEYLTLFTNIFQMIAIAIFWVMQNKLKLDLDLK